MKHQTSRRKNLSLFSKVIVLSCVWLLLSTGTAWAKEKAPQRLNEVIEKVKEKLAAGESREKVAQYISDTVDQRITALNRKTPDEKGSLTEEEYKEQKAKFDKWSHNAANADYPFEVAYWAWENRIGHCNEHAHMVTHILVMAGENDKTMKIQCRDHIYVVWGISRDDNSKPPEEKLKDLRSWKGAYIIDPWFGGNVKPAKQTITNDAQMPFDDEDPITRIDHAPPKLYNHFYQKWLKDVWVKQSRRPALSTCLRCEKKEIARCYNYPLWMLTGKNEHKAIEPDRLIRELKKAGFEQVGKLRPLNDISAEELKFGDVLVIGNQNKGGGGHAGIVWEFEGRKDVIRHFRGRTEWNSKDEVTYRSDKPKLGLAPFDYGIYIHTLDIFRCLGEASKNKDKRLSYGERDTSVWRSKWVNNWKLTKQRLTANGKETPAGPLRKVGGELKIAYFMPGMIVLKGIDFSKLNAKADPFEVSLKNYTVGKNSRLLPIKSSKNQKYENATMPIVYHLKEGEIHAVVEPPSKKMTMELWFNTKNFQKPALERIALRHLHIPADKKLVRDDFSPAHAACVSINPELLITDPNAMVSRNQTSLASVDDGPLKPCRKDYLMRIRYKDQTVYSYWKCDRDGVGLFFNNAFMNQLTPGRHEMEVLVKTENGHQFKQNMTIEVGKIGGLQNAKSRHIQVLKNAIALYKSDKTIDEGRKEYQLGSLVNDAEMMLTNGIINPKQTLAQVKMAMTIQAKIKEKPARRGGVPRSTKPTFTKTMLEKRLDLLGSVVEICEKMGTPEAYLFAAKEVATCESKSTNEPKARKMLPNLHRCLARLAIAANGDIPTARKHLGRALSIDQELGKVTASQAKRERKRWPKAFVDADMKMTKIQ